MNANGNGGGKGRILRMRLILLMSLSTFLIGIAGIMLLIRNPPAEDNVQVTTQATQRETLPAGAAQDTPTPVSTPGLVVIGHVRTADGSGVENVHIFRKYASYPGEVIATTDANGYYQSAFYAIPGDEMVTLWAEGEGYQFTPQYDYWRHYHGYEISTHDFTTR